MDSRENSDPFRCASASVCSHSGRASGRSAMASVSIAAIQKSAAVGLQQRAALHGVQRQLDGAVAVGPASIMAAKAVVAASILRAGPVAESGHRAAAGALDGALHAAR